MSAAAPAAAGENIGLSPARGTGLSRDSYDLRAPDGHMVCTVPRAKAELGITSGALELRADRRGEYLAVVNLRACLPGHRGDGGLGYPPEARESNKQRSPFAGARVDDPDLDEMRRSDPQRYRAWRCNRNAHAGTHPSDLGKGAVGRSGPDRTVHTRSE